MVIFDLFLAKEVKLKPNLGDMVKLGTQMIQGISRKIWWKLCDGVSENVVSVSLPLPRPRPPIPSLCLSVSLSLSLCLSVVVCLSVCLHEDATGSGLLSHGLTAIQLLCDLCRYNWFMTAMAYFNCFSTVKWCRYSLNCIIKAELLFDCFSTVTLCQLLSNCFPTAS